MATSRKSAPSSSNCTGVAHISGHDASDSFRAEGQICHIWDCVIGDNTPDETKRFYNVWAANFEEDMKEIAYQGPAMIVNFLETRIQLPKGARILDVGCGTGLVGVQLQKAGYKWMDGLDMSEEMLCLAKAKKIYGVSHMTTVCLNLTEKAMPVEYTYDAMILCSSFQPGHVAPSGLEKLAPQLSRGGHIVYCVRKLSDDKKIKTPFAENSFKQALVDLERRCGLTLVTQEELQEFQKGTKGTLGHFRKS